MNSSGQFGLFRCDSNADTPDSEFAAQTMADSAFASVYWTSAVVLGRTTGLCWRAVKTGEFAVGQLLPNGNPDPSFGTDGLTNQVSGGRSAGNGESCDQS